MKFEVYTQTDLFDALKPEWNNLLYCSTSNRIFSTWEWQSTWWSVYQPGELWVIACRDENHRLIGLAPWFIGTNPQQKRYVASIGSKEVTDYLDIIVDQDYVEPVLSRLAAYVADHASQFDCIELYNIPEDSVSHRDFPQYLENCGFKVSIEHEDVCPLIELPGSWSDYLALLDKKQRHELRRKLRRVQGANSGVGWYIAGTEHNITEEIEHFLDMMASSDPNKSQFLADPQNVDFFKRITRILNDRGWLQLSFLTVNGERAAAYLNFDYEGHILVYNSGLRPNEYGYLSPGIVLLAFNIQHAIETGHTIFDFLQGDETYKYHMGGRDTEVLNLKAELTGE